MRLTLLIYVHSYSASNHETPATCPSQSQSLAYRRPFMVITSMSSYVIAITCSYFPLTPYI